MQGHARGLDKRSSVKRRSRMEHKGLAVVNKTGANTDGCLSPKTARGGHEAGFSMLVRPSPSCPPNGLPCSLSTRPTRPRHPALSAPPEAAVATQLVDVQSSRQWSLHFAFIPEGLGAYTHVPLPGVGQVDRLAQPARHPCELPSLVPERKVAAHTPTRTAIGGVALA
jgi:hypothetical protein